MKKLRHTITKKNLGPLFVTASLVVVGVSMLVFSKAATPSTLAPSPTVSTLAAGGSTKLIVSPNPATVATGGTVEASIYEDSGSQGVLGLDIDVLFDQSKLEVIQPIDRAGSSFPVCPDKIVATGKITLYCITDFNGDLGESVTSVTGKKLIATIRFKALASTGTTSVTFSGRSTVKDSTNGNNVWDGNTAGATITFSSGTSGGSGGGTGGNTGGTGGTGGTSSGGSSNTTSGTGGTSGGTSGGSGSTTTGSGTSGGTSGGISAGGSGPSTVITGKGSGAVSVKIVDNQGRPVSGVTVIISKQKAVTDSSGVATFTGLEPGKYKVEAKGGVLGAATREVTVAKSNGTTSGAQVVSLTLQKTIDFKKYAIIAGGVVFALIVVALIVRWFKNRPLRPSGPSGGGSVFVNGASQSGAKDDDLLMNSSIVMATPEPSAPAVSEPSPSTGKESVAPTDTLDQIEKKVGASKDAAVTSQADSPVGKVLSKETPDEPVGGQVIKPTQPPSTPVA